MSMTAFLIAILVLIYLIYLKVVDIYYELRRISRMNK